MRPFFHSLLPKKVLYKYWNPTKFETPASLFIVAKYLTLNMYGDWCSMSVNEYCVVLVLSTSGYSQTDIRLFTAISVEKGWLDVTETNSLFIKAP